MVFSNFKRLHVECLEDRRMLAVMTVTSLTDGPLESLAGDSQLSLREAVHAINTGAAVDGIGPTSGIFGVNDQIVFSPSLFADGSQVLHLTAGELTLNVPMKITGPGQDLLTIDAQQNSRLIRIASPSDNFEIADLTLTGGRTSGLFQQGGAIHSQSTGVLSIFNATITENSTLGTSSQGGGIYAVGDVQLNSSTVSVNSTHGDGATGGGVHSMGNVSLVETTLAGNQTNGNFANGGGLFTAANATLLRSTVSENQTTGSASAGGGVVAQGNATLTESTVSGNRTLGPNGFGAGVVSLGDLAVLRSTVTDNHASQAAGGGLRIQDTSIIVFGSIVAGNTAAGGNPDISHGDGTVAAFYSLIGSAAGTSLNPANPGSNFIGTAASPFDPLLGPLASNGGPTRTHALLPGSPALDAGAPGVTPPNDQRGPGFPRVVDGLGDGTAVIDMGAYEAQGPPSADFDSDGVVDGHDFLAWQRGFGITSGATRADGDSDFDGDVDASDLAAWEVSFGTTAPAAVMAPLAAEFHTTAEPAASTALPSFFVEWPQTESEISSEGDFSDPAVPPFTTEQTDEAFADLAQQSLAEAIAEPLDEELAHANERGSDPFDWDWESEVGELFAASA